MLIRIIHHLESYLFEASEFRHGPATQAEINESCSYDYHLLERGVGEDEQRTAWMLNIYHAGKTVRVLTDVPVFVMNDSGKTIDRIASPDRIFIESPNPPKKKR